MGTVLLFLCCVLGLGLLAEVVQSGPISSPTESFQYEDFVFTFYSQKVNWLEAFTICRATRARLAVVHNKARADFLAKSMSEAQINYRDVWIGGKFTNDYWIWEATGKELPLTISKDGYPPWMNLPTQRGRNCLALDRKGYDRPVFIDLRCHLQKPFICEKSVVDAIENYPQRGIYMAHRNKTYVAYHARVTWEEALAFCRQSDGILTMIPDMKTAYFLVGMMRRSRPELEALWIGAQYLFNEWTWLSNNTVIANVTSHSDGYPPWKDNFSSHTPGKDCLILDHHACKHNSIRHRVGIHGGHDICEEPAFLDSDCSRRKAFICEKATIQKEKEDIFGVFDDRTYRIVQKNQTWLNASKACLERNESLAILDTNAKLGFVVSMTTEESENVKHMWIGGKYSLQKAMWLWLDNTTIPGGTPSIGHLSGEDYFTDTGADFNYDAIIDGPTLDEENDIRAFPPWCPRNDTEEMKGDECLNLDSAEDNRGMFYSLDCQSAQSYVCEGSVEEINENNSASMFILQRKHVEFDVAMAICEKKNMSLAVVNNMNEVARITDVIPQDQDVWIGGKRENAHWKWAKTQEPIPDVTGSDGYPPWDSFYTNVGKQCLAMRIKEDFGRVFVEQPCKDQLWFICQQ